ncbi:MAG: alanine racemase, partial [Saprospiraceae bacterium]|nr:alanine racemase [Saprospiraceae bacterium]
ADLAIFEAGISRPDEMKNLETIIKPDVGIMTNLGSAHAEGFIDAKQKLEEKLNLFDHCQAVICCMDQELVFEAIRARKFPYFTWSFHSENADLKVALVDQNRTDSRIQYHLKTGPSGTIVIPFTDPASIENAVHCLALIKWLKPDKPELDLAFQNLLPVAMRLEALEGINGSLVINDVYNADLESLAVAVAFSTFQSSQRAKTAILSDMKQQGNDPDLYQKVATILEQYDFKRLFAVGPEIRKIQPYLHGVETFFFPDTKTLLASLKDHRFGEELILVKGAREFGLEEVSEWLSLKKHQTVLEVNLAALARNLKVLEGFLTNSKIKMMAMVKAAAYGSGGVEIARFLTSRHIDYLAVAYLDEGVELRKAGITLPIMVLNADINAINRILAYDLEPEIFSLAQLKQVLRYANQYGKKIPIHLKVETGMNRLGLERQELDEVLGLLEDSHNVEVKSVFSHLAVSDDDQERSFTHSQIEQFREFAAKISDSLAVKPIWHLANSNAIVRYPEAQFDMVRLGIGMYGIGMPRHLSLEPVHTLRTFVSQVKVLHEGASIGYGRTEKVRGTMEIATIGIGYADGLIRKAGNRRYAVVINGRYAPIVGNICMDMTMIDVTGIEDIEIGTEVIVFGKEPTIDMLAQAADTIPYEVFTSLSARVKRIYTYE